MSNRTKDSHTEELIKETAKRIFFSQGQLHATTQEIADAAGVNRALIHYYFRSREQLFEAVFKEAMQGMFTRMFGIFTSEMPFREKIEAFLEAFIAETADYPYLENFIITEINRNPENHAAFLPSEQKKTLVDQLKKEVQNEIDKGNLQPIKPEHFIVNMMSMCAYPLLSKPIIQLMFELDENGYQQFIRERAKVISRVLLGGN